MSVTQAIRLMEEAIRRDWRRYLGMRELVYEALMRAGRGVR